MQNYNFSFYEKIKLPTSKTITLQQFFDVVKTGKGIKNKIAQLKSLPTKKQQDEFKRKNLPSITVSGVFNQSHAAKDLLQHTNLMQIDFDKVNDITSTRKLLEADEYTFICFLSPTGTGLKLFVKMNGAKHPVAFNSFENYFRTRYNLQIDEKCKDVGRLCFFSYDENIFVNENCRFLDVSAWANQPTYQQKKEIAEEKKKTTITPGKKVEAAQEPKPLAENKLQKSSLSVSQIEQKTKEVENIVSQIEAQKTDITSGYKDWLKIGFALSNLGEAARNYFIRISKFHHAFNEVETNKQFDNCLSSGKNGVALSTFFYITKQHGFVVKKEIAPPPITAPIKKNEAEFKPLKNSENLLVRVEHFLSFHFEFRYNEILRQPEMKRKGSDKFEVINENVVARFLELNNFKYSATKVKGLLCSDYVKPYNPFISYFENLPNYNPQTEIDYIHRLSTYVKCISESEQQRFEKQFKKMLVRSVACSVWNGLDNNTNFNKHIFTLVQYNQNGGKSSFLRWLCPTELQKNYTEYMDFRSKDSLINLATMFLINLDELASLGKQEVDTVKGFVSNGIVNCRYPFDSRTISTPRRANFVASTNNDNFLTDTTGSVRFLCFEIESINWSYAKEFDINKIWAQAYFLYKNKYPFQLDKLEVEENEKANQNFTIQTPEEQFILERYYPENNPENDRVFYTSSEFVQKFYSETNFAFKTTEKRIGQLFRKLGFMRFSRRKEGDKFAVYGYFLGVKNDFATDLEKK